MVCGGGHGLDDVRVGECGVTVAGGGEAVVVVAGKGAAKKATKDGKGGKGSASEKKTSGKKAPCKRTNVPDAAPAAMKGPVVATGGKTTAGAKKGLLLLSSRLTSNRRTATGMAIMSRRHQHHLTPQPIPGHL